MGQRHGALALHSPDPDGPAVHAQQYLLARRNGYGPIRERSVSRRDGAPRTITKADRDALLLAGLTLEEAWDVAELASMYNLTNRMAMATNMLPNAEYSTLAR